MRKWPIFIMALSVGLLAGIPVFGQVTELNESSPFASDSVLLNFEGPAEGVDATQVYAKWGVVFSGVGSSNPKIEEVFVLNFSNAVLRNAPVLGSSANKPLAVNFKFPVKKIGFKLIGITAGVQVTVQAFSDEGTSLGSIQKTGLNGDVFLGVSTNSSKGISKLTISYGAETEPERIDALKIEYLQRPQFRNYLAQVADGPIGGGSYLQTTITITNLSASTAQGEVQFKKSDGSAMNLPIGGVSQSSVDLAIPAFSSVTLTTDGSDATIPVGYAKILTNVPVGGTAIFRIMSGTGSVMTEAGVGSETGSSVSVGAVQKAAVGKFNTGIAAVNTGTKTATALIELYNEEGDLVASDNSVLQLGAGQHIARFLDQIFPALKNSDFNGTIRIRGDVEFALVILRTSTGLVMSSLPVGTLQ